MSTARRCAASPSSSSGAEAFSAAASARSGRARRGPSALGSHRRAATLARTCSGVLAPAITEQTAGIAASPPIATSSRPTPRSAARPRAPRSADAPAAGTSPGAIRVPSGHGSPRPYFPLSRPRASGKYGMKPIPSSAQAERSPPQPHARARNSGSGPSTNRVRPRSDEKASASRIAAAEKFDEPMWRTLPSRTSSSSAPSVSSIGVTASGRWYW